MDDRKWEELSEGEFEAMLGAGLPDLPPEGIVEEVTPWKRAWNRVLVGMALSTVTLNFWLLDTILPAVGVVLMLLGFVTGIAGILLIMQPFVSWPVDAIWLCGLLLILEGVLNAGCTVYTAMALRDLDKAAEAAETAQETESHDSPKEESAPSGSDSSADSTDPQS